VFVVFAKVLNPQYLWWFLSFMPLVVLTHNGRLWWIVAAALGLSAALTQLVYPLNYTEFVNWFRTASGSSLWFTVILIRNGLLLAATVVAISALAGPRRAPAARIPAHHDPVANSADR
jgi:threonine/homoserine/homoserine lactone efflux protein